ncbi:MAG TPA: hypothetical protein VHB27_16880 [Rhodopila sp.]|uniref:hypothetical protein n=1 Tax=Rhodopila sp. TaxID=2480087 RepID=UPI002C55D68A|nr:hypothetical protein [Rhodopila sp.]HVY16899.1 hypothetical protein [Rhodopila sp.]
MGVKAGFSGFRPDEMAESGASTREEEGPDQASESDLARDWITLWQSELNALAADPEMMRSWRSAVQAWSNVATWFLHIMPKAAEARHDDTPRRRPGPKPAARPTPAVAASDARDDEIARLTLHISQLERRLADLERRIGGRPAVDTKRRRNRDV